MLTPGTVAKNTELSGNPADPTVGDFDDILMFTTRSSGRPFVGRGGQSYVAEVAWFIRGHTLHRRVLLVMPGASPAAAQGCYANSDISVHLNSGNTTVSPNTLADLTRRECRFAHPAAFPTSGCAFWTWNTQSYTLPTLPTLYECSEYKTGPVAYTWSPATVPSAFSAQTVANLDFWTNATGHRLTDNAYASGARSDRVSDDIILTNVIGFDVKAWDPKANGGQGAYVDLGYNTALTGNSRTQFSHAGANNSGFGGIDNYHSRIYDTWSTTYLGSVWNDGLDNGTSGANGIVDDDAEKTNPPPYSVPLRGIQVKIRVFEPDSKQIREVTVVQDFLPQ
jgi:hypothetical protein